MNPLAEVLGKLKKADEGHDISQTDYLFLTVGQAVASLSSTMKDQVSTTREETQEIVTEY